MVCVGVACVARRVASRRLSVAWRASRRGVASRVASRVVGST
ncbi:hypothetical protein ACXZ9C_11610 [Streptococcus agalactiae]